MPDQHTTQNKAAAWLLSEYEATDPEYIIPGAYAYGRTVIVQPMFSLKSVMEAGTPMRVTELDYKDPHRWWL